MNNPSYPQKLFMKWRKRKDLKVKKKKSITTKDTLFVQFMRRNKTDEVEMMNGFSHVHDQCKNIGDFYWTYYIPDKAEENELPITKGTVYISAFYAPHIYQSLLWAQKYPNVKFIVGGPALITSNFNPVEFPKNWETRLGLAENDIFGGIKPNLSWKIEMPKIQKVPKKLICSFTINRSCSWKKCIFCARAFHDQYQTFENTIDNLHLPNEHDWSVWLLSPTIRPSFMEQFHKLPTEGIRQYFMFIRSDKTSYNALKKNLPKCHPELRKKFVFRLGIEFPSDRMLRLMDKGTTAEWQLRTMKMLNSFGCNMKICFILGWNVLTPKDVESVKYFADHLNSHWIPKIDAALFYLVYNYSSDKDLVRLRNKAETQIITHEFNDIYKYKMEVPILNPEQLELNRQVRDIYLKNFNCGEAVTSQQILGGKKIDPTKRNEE